MGDLVWGTYHRISLLRLYLRILWGLSEGLEAIFTPLKSNVTGRDLLCAPCAVLVFLGRAHLNVPPAEPAGYLPHDPSLPTATGSVHSGSLENCSASARRSISPQ